MLGIRFQLLRSLHMTLVEEPAPGFPPLGGGGGPAAPREETAGTEPDDAYPPEKRDFFISYNSNDEDWATWIAFQLKKAGYTTFIQAWDFRPGSNFVVQMQKAAEKSERTIAVLSETYLTSAFTLSEWAAAFKRDPTGEQGLLLPVRVRECEPKGLLAQIVYIDLVDLPDEQAVVERLLAGIKRDRVEPPVSPLFPGGGQLGRRLLAKAQTREQLAQGGTSLSPRQQQNLYQKLLTLDFSPQVLQFKNVITEQRVAAFLVHGPPLHGQKLLTHRLVRFRDEWGNGQRIVIDAASNGIGKSSSALWGQIASKLNLRHDTDKEVLAERVCQWWETQDVIFVFHPVDYIPADILATWLDEFWKPIAGKARKKLPESKSNTHLLLFLLDFGGQVAHTTIKLLDRPEELVNSDAPFKLPPTEKVREDMLVSWIGTAAEELPATVDAMALIHDTEQGTPDLLYQKIFDCCGLTWEGVELP